MTGLSMTVESHQYKYLQQQEDLLKVIRYARDHGCIDLYPELEGMVEMAEQVAHWELPEPKAQPTDTASSINLPNIDWPSIDSVWVGTDTPPSRDWLVPLLVGTAAAAAAVVVFGVFG